MGSMIVRYRDADAVRWGRLEGPAPIHASDLVTVDPLAIQATTTGEVISAFESGALRTTSAGAKIKASTILSPVTNDATLLCQGLNYLSHAAEAQHHVRRANLIFSKASSSLTGPYSPIIRPPEVELLDYEVEIGVVLRSDIRGPVEVTNANLGDFVAGVVLCNDASARDTMFGASFLQWFHGKSYRSFCPAGPVLYLLDRHEVATTLDNLEINLSLNNEPRQSARSTQLIYKPAETLTHISSWMDMKRGDMLLTGTPGGVTAPASAKLVEILKTHLMEDTVRRDAFRVEIVKTRPFMKAGDVVTATLHDSRLNISLGGHENTVADANG